MSLLGSSESAGVRTVFTPPPAKMERMARAQLTRLLSVQRQQHEGRNGSSADPALASPKPKPQLELPSLSAALPPKNHIPYRAHCLSSVLFPRQR